MHFSNHIKHGNPLNKKEILEYLNKISIKKSIRKDDHEINNRCIFTFDDGIKDNLEVAKSLEGNKSSGIFFITTMPYENGKMLDVHMIHHIVYQEEIDYVYKVFIKLIGNNSRLNESFKEYQFSKLGNYNFYGDQEKISEIKIFMNRFFPLENKSIFLQD